MIESALRAGILSPMGKNKPRADRHATARRTTSIPEPWHAVARLCAAKRQQPVTYLLIALLAEEAKTLGITDLPSTPWAEPDPT